MFSRKKSFPLFKTIIFSTIAILGILGVVLVGVFYVLEDQIPSYVENEDPAKKGAASLIEIGKIIAGFESERTYLVLLQNDHELRPTGGFIGQYAIVTVENGEVKDFFTQDSGVLDTSAPRGVQVPRAPVAMKTYLNQNFMFFRDSNWQPEFDRAAAQIAQIYALEQGRSADKIDGVIAIDTHVLVALLKYLGPVTVKDVEFNEKNVVDALEYQVEVAYKEQGIKKENRKDILGDLGIKLQEKAAKVSPIRFPQMIKAAQKLADEKHIIMFDYDTGLQTWYKAQGWAGVTEDLTDAHMVRVIDANLNGFKTDRVMKRGIEHVITEGDARVSKLSLTYKNTATEADYRTRDYRSYTRVYLPKDAKVVDVEGKTHTQEAEEGYDDYLMNNLRVVGFFHKVPLTETRTITITYETPINEDTESVRLRYIKQPGTDNPELTVDAQFGKHIASVEPSGAKIKGSHFTYEGNLNIDREFTIDLVKRN